jgi:hypothetical protein
MVQFLRELYNKLFKLNFKEYKQCRTQPLRIFSAQAQDICLKIAIYIHYLMSHLQNNILYICKQYIKITKPQVP